MDVRLLSNLWGIVWISSLFLMQSFLWKLWINRGGSDCGWILWWLVDICLNGVLTAERDMAFSEEAWILECRMSCLQGVSGFLQASQFSYEVLSEWNRNSLSGAQARRKSGLFTPSKEKSRKKTHTVNPWLVGMGLNGGSLAWHTALLLQQLHLQEALLVGCGLFQCMLEMFKPRGGRQLRLRPGGALPCQLLSPHQTDNPASPFSWAQWLLPQGKSVRATLGWIFSQRLKTGISWTEKIHCARLKKTAFFNSPKTLFWKNINIWVTER